MAGGGRECVCGERARGVGGEVGGAGGWWRGQDGGGGGEGGGRTLGEGGGEQDGGGGALHRIPKTDHDNATMKQI